MSSKPDNGRPLRPPAAMRIIHVVHQLPYVIVREGLPAPVNSLARRRSISTAVPAVESPVRFVTDRRRGHSVLHAGIASLAIDSGVDTVYVGNLGQVLDRDSGAVHSLDSTQHDAIRAMLWDKHRCIPVYTEEKDERGHYEGYCKQILWPLLHYILVQKVTDGRQESVDWDSYKTVNQASANAVTAVYEPGDMVWVHDYHLLLVPSMIRALKPSATIGLFLHTPFPTSEVFRCLPARSEMLTGVLGANLIGFQTYGYARHFVSSCTRVLGLESTPTGIEFNGSVVAVGIFPVGVNVARAESMRKLPEVIKKIDALRTMYGGKKVIVGRDKLDLNRGVYQKLLAFDKFLIDYPEWQGEVVLVQVTTPTGTDSTKLESKVSELVASINGRFGSISFTPVHHIHQLIDTDEYYALLSVADVGLITSVRDGMNTTSHEFVICQQDNYGPLILSEFTGTAGSMSAASLVNPWDYGGVAYAINEALLMSKEERHLKHNQLLAHVTTNTVQHWAQAFIKELAHADTLLPHAEPTPALDLTLCKQSFDCATKRLIMFDYDGTLTNIVSMPHEAKPSKRMLIALTTLCEDPRNAVYVVSGRDAATLEEWVGDIPNLGLSAEHGCFLRHPRGKWINFSEHLDLSWKKEVVDIFNYYTERTQGSFVEQKRCAITWHYRLADPEYGLFQAKECQNHLENAVTPKYPIEILIGKKNLEVRPVSINKGEIVKRLLNIPSSTSTSTYTSTGVSPLVSPRNSTLTIVANTLSTLSLSVQASTTNTTVPVQQHSYSPQCACPFDFVYCAGDDKTDEDMFKAIKRGVVLSPSQIWAVTIGSASKLTSANWHSLVPEEVIETIETWVGIVKPR